MSSRRPRAPRTRGGRTPLVRLVAIVAAISGVALAASCAADLTPPDSPPISISSIVIDGGPRAIEIGTTVNLTATAKDPSGKSVSTPLVWRSSNEKVASFEREGVLATRDTGSTIITASALGVTSTGIEVKVVWFGPSNVAVYQFNPPNAIGPGSTPVDSVRVLVTNLGGGPAVGAKVAFAVTGGGGTISPSAPTLVTVGNSGTAAAKWTLGPNTGKQTVTATVVNADTTRDTLVKNNPVTFTLTAYTPLAIVAGDTQTANVLAPVPVAPVVKLVDSLGKPRAGIPVTFAPTGNGRVANTVASTAADGTASPGVWTLGDVAGDQQLVVSVEAAKVVLHAKATGSTTKFAATAVATAQAATCALTADQFASCMGQIPQIGGGDSAKAATTPTLTQGDIHFTSLAGGSASAHFCGTTSDLSIYCWGVFALVDTANGIAPNGASPPTTAPTRLPSNLAWVQVTPGAQHNCALANDKTAYCWGANVAGQLGDNTVTQHLSPQPVAGGFKFTVLAAGASHECGITADAALFCWGLNANGQIGDGTTTQRQTPTAVTSALKWKAVGAGNAWTCALTQAGAPACWGAGTGRNTPSPYNNAPVLTSLSVGNAHACGLTDDGTAYCWGDNSNGQLGDSTTTSRPEPTAVETTLRFRSVSAGVQQTCGITTDGFLACWGRNTVGEIGLTTPVVQTTPRYVVLGVKP